MRRTSLIALLVCGSAGIAAADDDAPWDGTYVHRSEGGTELCPLSSESVVVSGGRFAIPWIIKLRGKLVRVGQIAGSVRATGLAEIKATLLDPLPAAVVAELRAVDDSPEQLQKIASEMRLGFAARQQRALELSSGACSAAWDAPAVVAPVATPAPVAVQDKPVTTHDKPARSPKPAKPTKPKPPATPIKAPPPLAAGSAAWDATYTHTSDFGQDWRCPKAFKTLVVKQGRFSIPWHIDVVDDYGNVRGEVVLGQIDGSIAASGKVTLRTAFSIGELPPEVHRGATLASMHDFVPTMTFTKNGARRAHLAFASQCEYGIEDTTTVAKKPGQSTTKPSGKGTAGASCSSDSECASGYCTLNGCARHNPNRSCSSDSQCAPGHACTNQGCASRKTGSPAFANGMECNIDSDCASDHCELDKCTSR